MTIIYSNNIIHLWLKIVYLYGRVLADAHIPWACEAFTNLHIKDLLETPQLCWYIHIDIIIIYILRLIIIKINKYLIKFWNDDRCWRLFMIKLWNHGLVDPKTINVCNLILDQHQNQQIDPTTTTTKTKKWFLQKVEPICCNLEYHFDVTN